MGLIDLILRRTRPQDEYNRGSDSFVSRWARPPSRNTQEWLGTFSTSPRLAVVDRIASDTAGVDGHLYYVNPDGSETLLTRHPFLDFMEQPNPLYEMTSAAMWRLHEIYLMLVGESFFLIERDERGMPTEMWNVPPHWVSQTPYLGNPYYTILSTSGVTMTVPVEDMFVMKQLNPLDPFMRGLGSAESIADEVEIDEYAAKFQKRFFYNDATPPLVFLMPDATPTQRNDFMARWNKQHRGVENSHKAAAFTGNVDVKEIGGGSNYGKNLGFLESREAMRDAVLEHFGVPREIMGITENSNRSTADAAQYIYAKNVLTPRIRNREEAINKQLLPLFGTGLVWRYDAVVPYDKDFNKQKALDAYNAGLITKDEARELLDLPEVEGGKGKVYKVSINDLFINDDEDPAVVSEALSSQPVPEQKADRRMNVSAALKLEDAAIKRDERMFRAVMVQHFAEQQAEISKRLGLSTKEEDPIAAVFSPLKQYLSEDGEFVPESWESVSEAEKARVTAAVADGLLDWSAQAKRLTELLTPYWKIAYDDGAQVSADAYGIPEIMRPEFKTPAQVYGGQRVVGIEETTRNSIADIVSKGVTEGTSQKNLKQQIQTAMGPKATEERAALIARQETATALATGQFDMMKSSGASTKTWHHRPQANPRDGTHGKVNHVAMEGETVGIDEYFSNGLRFPRDPEDGRAEEVINCRCYLSYDGWGEARKPASSTPTPAQGEAPIRFSEGDEAYEFFGQYPDRSLRRENRELYDRLRDEYMNKSQFGVWKQTLSDSEYSSISNYTGPDYSAINGLLRHEMTKNQVAMWNQTCRIPVEDMIDDITAAISRFELKSDIMVYRTCENDVLENLKLKVGSTFHDNGFGSTSVTTRKKAGGNIVMQITVPKGKGVGAWVNPLNPYEGSDRDEYEFLLNRGTDYLVTGVEKIDGDTIVKMKVVGRTETSWSYASKEEVVELWKKRGIYDEGNAKLL